MFQKAVKKDARLRLALVGPAGSGKTYSSLEIATELGGPIAYVDTEHGSASKYADLFSFDVIEPDKFDPRDLIKTIKAAEDNGYRVIVVDSLSHYWMGTGGTLDLVDAASKRTQGNSFAAWKHVTPIHNELVDTIIASRIHVIVTMRTKTEWVIEEVNGKKAPRKVGMQPVMRDGIEFEFDVCGDLDQDNTLTITKSRCPELAAKVINRPGKQMAQSLKKWLAGAPAEPKPQPQQPAPPAPQQIGDDDIPENMGGTHQPEPPKTDRVAEARNRAAAGSSQPSVEKPWNNFGEMVKCLRDQLVRVGPEAYAGEMAKYGVKDASEFTKGADALAAYQNLIQLPSAQQEAA